jgi:hypothetical protein
MAGYRRVDYLELAEEALRDDRQNRRPTLAGLQRREAILLRALRHPIRYQRGLRRAPGQQVQRPHEPNRFDDGLI